MARPQIIGLDDYRLTPTALSRLGSKAVRVTIQLAGRSLAALRHLEPAERAAARRRTLANQLQRLRREFPDVDFVSRGGTKPSWTIDAVVPARFVVALANRPQVRDLTVQAVEGRRLRRRRATRGWYSVWSIVEIQIEGDHSTSVTLEDRIVLVKAWDADDAQRRLRGMWTRYAKPYANSRGEPVRWQLISIRDVYALPDATIDSRGTEVYSRLRRARRRPRRA